MRKIGFIDHWLDEWHANNYPAWITGRGGGRYGVAYAWAESDKSGGLTTAQWCAKYSVQRVSSMEELVERSDCIVVLSPDNPERHVALSALALRSGKPVYVDKTFALTLAEAEGMFDLAEKHRTRMYSTSALRYAPELGWLEENGISQGGVILASARGPGEFINYGIHQIEMIVAAMGTGVQRAMAFGPQGAPMLVYEYDGGRRATVSHLPWNGFSLAVQDASGHGAELRMEGDMWGPFVDALLRFFDTGVPPVPREQTCQAVAMAEAGLRALRQPGIWVDLP
jgi:hypothetical protein